jgi:hypothetical protein
MDSLTKEDLELIRRVFGYRIHHWNSEALVYKDGKCEKAKDYNKIKVYVEKLERVYFKVLKLLKEMG